MSAALANSTTDGGRDGFGCSLGNLEDDRHLTSAGINFYSKGSSSPPRLVTTEAADKGFLIGVSTKGGHRRRIHHEHHSTLHDFEENSVYVRNLSEDYKADLEGTFGFILLEISHATLSDIAEGADSRYSNELRQTSATLDPTLGGLARTLFLAVEKERAASKLFLDHLAVAMGMHILSAYGNQIIPTFDKRRTLSRKNERLAKEIIECRYTGDLTMDELAGACSLSKGTFIRAFRETTGKTPYQWLTQHRLQKAQDLLLRSPLSLTEISEACGFANQSHFTRAFAGALGAPPGAWRRDRQS